MALLEKDLYVALSTIPNSGNGLFTKVDIPAGTRIVEYKGRITTWKEVEHDSENGYLYVVSKKHVIDAGKTKKALARYANDAKGLARIKGVNNNCEYVNDKGRVFIEALKNIPAGSELLVGYGKEYWEVVRENIKIEKKKLLEKKKSE